MSNFIQPNAGNLASLLGKSKEASNPLQDLMQKKQEADNLAKEMALPPHKKAPGKSADQFSPSAQGLQAASMSASSQSAYSYSQTMSLTLETKEGDVVKVDFRQLYAHYKEEKTQQSAEMSPKGAKYFDSKKSMEATSFEERFGFSVKGSLNKDELAAVYDVFKQVDELATNFFDGNVEQAFQKAVNMGVDFGQLKSVNLNLQQTETMATGQQQAAAYKGVEQGVAGSGAENTSNKGGNIADLPPYLQKMQDVIARLDEQFTEARSTMENFMATVNASRYPDQGNVPTWLDRIREFHDALLAKANLDPATAKPVVSDAGLKNTASAKAVDSAAKVVVPSKEVADIK